MAFQDIDLKGIAILLEKLTEQGHVLNLFLFLTLSENIHFYSLAHILEYYSSYFMCRD